MVTVTGFYSEVYVVYYVWVVRYLERCAVTVCTG